MSTESGGILTDGCTESGGILTDGCDFPGEEVGEVGDF